MKNPFAKLFANTDKAARKRRLVALLALAVFLGISLALFLTVGPRLISLVSSPKEFRSWVQSRGLLGKLAFACITAVQVVVAVIPGEPVEFAAGYAFGAWQGLLLTELGIILGSGIVICIAKYGGRRLIEAFIEPEKLEKLSFLQQSPRRDAILFLVFFLPGTPKDVLTYFLGLIPVGIPRYLVLTGIARIPSVLTSTLAGAAAGEESLLTTIVIYAATAVLSLGGMLVYRRLTAKNTPKSE